MCPKPCFGHTYKVSAWNSQKKYEFCNTQISREYFGELAKHQWNNPLVLAIIVPADNLAAITMNSCMHYLKGFQVNNTLIVSLVVLSWWHLNVIWDHADIGFIYIGPILNNVKPWIFCLSLIPFLDLLSHCKRGMAVNSYSIPYHAPSSSESPSLDIN